MPTYIRIAAAAIALALVTPPAFGLAQRTFVASFGNDANPCSLPLPCRGFAAAIAQTTAGGEVIVEDSAGYGTVTITKSISIISPAGVYAGISLSGVVNGVTINAPGAKVLLRNVKINGSFGNGQNGVVMQSGAELTIDRCEISNVGASGVLVTAAASTLTMTDSVVRHGAPGVKLQADAKVVLQRVRLLTNDGAGGNGIRVESPANVSVAQSVIAANGQNGVQLIGSNGSARVDNTLITDNIGDGVRMGSSSGVVSIIRSTVSRNAFGLSASSTTSVSASRNLISHNGSGFVAAGASAVATSNENTFARNGTAALDQSLAATLRTVRGADNLPSNAGEESTPTSGTITPVSPF